MVFLCINLREFTKFTILRGINFTFLLLLPLCGIKQVIFELFIF